MPVSSLGTSVEALTKTKVVQGAPLVDLERADQRQAEKFLVEHPRLFASNCVADAMPLRPTAPVDIGARLRDVWS
jgi:hypothetical protein